MFSLKQPRVQWGAQAADDGVPRWSEERAATESEKEAGPDRSPKLCELRCPRLFKVINLLEVKMFQTVQNVFLPFDDFGR